MIRYQAILVLVGVHAVLLARWTATAQDEKERTGTIVGELKSRVDSKTGKSATLEILAPGEVKARKYLVAYNPRDPKAEAPFKVLLAAVNTANVGDRVRIEWVNAPKGSEGGFFVTAFQVIQKSDAKKDPERKQP
jgi:hypothetical protein